MSKISDLIHELCPAGVIYKKLSDVVQVNRGRRLTKNQLSDDGLYEVYHGSKDVPLGKYSEFNVSGDTVIVVNTGGIGGVKYLKDNFWCSDGSFYLEHNDMLNNKFLYYYLSQYEKYFSSQKRVGGVPTIDRSVVENIKIPILPLIIQEEIVRVLDKFSSNGLERLLSLELELRKEQYEHYLKRTFKSIDGKKVALGSVVTFNRGKRVVKKDLENDKIMSLFPVYQNSLTPLGYYDKSNFDCNKTIIISAGAAGKIGFVEEKIWAADDCLRCLCSDEILDKYLYYFLKSSESYIQSMVRRASVPRISANVFEKMSITIPPIDIQKKIIGIFDRFEKIINNVNDGLPAEIELRRKQYEYYRNKLLSFEELSVSE